MKQSLLAGAAKVLITPEERTRLAGFDPTLYVANPPEDILDDLFARILVLDNGTRRLALVSIDCLWITEDMIRHRDKTGLPGRYGTSVEMLPAGTRSSWASTVEVNESYMIVVATHTHSAPTHIQHKYVERITEAIRTTAGHLVPVNVSIAVGSSPISAHRRPTLFPNPDVEIDQSLYTLFFEREDGSPLASIVNYAVHPTILHPSQEQSANRVSAECVGRAMSKLEDRMGPGFVSLFAQGFSGDVAPVLPGKGALEDSYPNVEKAGEQLFFDILDALNHRKHLNSSEIQMLETTVSFPTRDGYYRNALQGRLCALSIGEVALLFTPGEIFNGYVDKIRPQSPFEHTLLISLAKHHLGYIPTREAFRDGKGGYELQITAFDERVDPLFTSTALGLLKQLSEES